MMFVHYFMMLGSSLSSVISEGPLFYSDICKIYSHYDIQTPSKSKPKPPAPNLSGNEAQRRRALYRQHHRLYALGPKVFGDHLLLVGVSVACSSSSLHALYDPLFGGTSSPVGSP